MTISLKYNVNLPVIGQWWKLLLFSPIFSTAEICLSLIRSLDRRGGRKQNVSRKQLHYDYYEEESHMYNVFRDYSRGLLQWWAISQFIADRYLNLFLVRHSSYTTATVFRFLFTWLSKSDFVFKLLHFATVIFVITLHHSLPLAATRIRSICFPSYLSPVSPSCCFLIHVATIS